MLILATVCGSYRDAQAQTPKSSDTIRGRVVKDSSVALPGVTVSVTRAPDRAFLTTTTDSLGRFEIVFPDGTGDYLVHAALVGYTAARQRLLRDSTGRMPAVALKLESSVQQLATVKVESTKPTVYRQSGIGSEAGEAASLDYGVKAAYPPGLEGNLAAIASTMPGVVSSSSGISAFGLSSSANGSTLNGLGFSSGSIPRDARRQISVTSSTYDPSRGWFSGLQTNVDLSQGNLFSSRTLHVTGDTRSLQFGPEGSDGSSQEFQKIDVSAGGDGTVHDDKLLYNFGIQGGRRMVDAYTIQSAPADVLRSAGLSSNAAAEFLSAVRAKGVPLPTSIDASSISDNVSFIGRIDYAPYNFFTFEQAKKTWALIGFGDAGRSSRMGTNATSTPGGSSRSNDLSGGVQALYSSYAHKDYLVDFTTTLSGARHNVQSENRAPLGLVRLNSEFVDGQSAIAEAAFGGTGNGNSVDKSLTWESVARTEFYWAKRETHRVRFTADARFDNFSRTDGVNTSGTFLFNSLDDLVANRPALFTRALNDSRRSGGEWNGFLSAGDSWRMSENLQVRLGVRLEGNHFTYAPPLNAALEQSLGVRTDIVPNTMDVLPRMGFTWRIAGRESRDYTQFGMFAGRKQRYLRGGIGAFRDFIQSTLLASSLVNTGLPGGSQRISCIGASAPVPDWSTLDQLSAIPSACSDGAATHFADSAPGIDAFSHDYDAPKTWRANLAYASTLGSVDYSIEGNYSISRNLAEFEDINFNGTPGFVTTEGRDVFVPRASIDPVSGRVALAGSRRDEEFGSVISHGSHGSLRNRQMTIVLTPPTWKSNLFASAAYTFGSSRVTSNGFSSTAFASPLQRESSRGDFDARHQFRFQSGFVFHGFTFSAFGRLQSGLPFTPMIGSDVNGDGLANDRAFIPGIGGSPDSNSSFFSEVPSSIRECLSRQAGTAAKRNSCEGPWTATLDAQIVSLRPPPFLHRDGSVTLAFSNPLGGIDQLVHGASHLKGWGSTPSPDRTLYYVRGFDPATSSYEYEQNPRFGASAPARSIGRTPFRITLDVRLSLGRSIQRQQLDRSLAPGRNGNKKPKLTVPQLLKRYERNIPDPYAELLEQSDSLLLTRDQMEAITATEKVYRQAMDSIWIPFVQYLDALPDAFDSKAALERQEKTTDGAWEYTRLDVKAKIGKILSPLQIRLSPWMVKGLYNADKPLHVRIFY